MMETTKDTKRNLPAGWRWVRLAEVATVISGQHILESDYNQSGRGIGYLTGPADFGATKPTITKWTEKPRVFCEPMDVLVTVKGAGVGKVNLSPDIPVAIGRQLMAIRGYHGSIDRMFLFGFLITSFNHFQKNAMGATVPGLSREDLEMLGIPLPPFDEQQRIAEVLREQMAAVEKARAAAQARLEAAKALPASFVTESLTIGFKRRYSLGDCLIEVRNGIGTEWSKQTLLGATRDGVAPAKEPVGKSPERYKLVDPVTVFYNPMRILLGSIAMVDEDDAPGITSPDYVVVKGRQGVLDTRWFYYWFRSVYGLHLIDSLSRGAVRERILFKRLSEGEIDLPDYKTQRRASARMKQVRMVVETVTKELTTINALPAALLRRAFNGEL